MEKVAFLFAGQGSQYVGMGKDFFDSFPESKIIFNQACDVLGFNISQICFNGPPEQLKPTNISQPAIVTMAIAALEAFRRRHGVTPEYCAGLSLGEYSALIAAGAIKFRDGLVLIKKRGEIMEQEAQRLPGRMAAILELDLAKVSEICSQTGAEIANLNCPGQVVVTGKALAVNDAANLCTRAGAKRVVHLEVSGGFHSSLMLHASERLKKVLDETPIRDPGIPVIGNFTARPQQTADEIRANLVKQIHSPVRWEESMRYMLAQGVTAFFEFGPGKVLKGLMRKIDPNAKVITVDKAEDLNSLRA
ncbi:MAG: ACP S-malonyltransferase [Candidatus Omnitrophica bacterium]|nr:ACP S-malonyltransferase [Candidatus Omnitrophota bacterium]